MESEWPQVPLGEVITLQRGFDLPSQDRKPGRVPIISSSGITDYHSEVGVPGPGVVTGRYGTIGQVFLSKEDFWPLNTTLWVKDFHGNDPLWASYLLRTIDFMSCSDKSSVPGVNRNDLHRILVLLSPLDDQRAIAGVLGALDDKIEQNRRTARALERLARAIFRAWFVDFEPVKVKAVGAASFPSMPQPVFDALPIHFVDSNIGPVPEGWKVKAATEVAEVKIGKTPPRKEPRWFSTDPSDIPWLSIKDMAKAGVFISDTSEYLTLEAVDTYRVRRIPDRSVLLSFKLTVGRVAIVDGEITSNEAIAHFVPRSHGSLGPEFLYCYLANFDYDKLGSTSSIATATNSKVVKGMPVIVPNTELAAAFTEFVRPAFENIRSLVRECRKLSEVRDYLLPRLLSGSVRVEVANG